jgi:UDPglucose--hexose-1-phosphate uridylyltransferase
MTDSRSMPFDADQHPHRRLNLLTGRWVLVSPQRTQRPWQGAREAETAAAPMAAHDPACHLCAGNTRANGTRNPHYTGTWVFANDFPALLSESPDADTGDPLLQRAAAQGECRVMCFSPHHGATLPELSPAAMRAVIDTWCHETAALGARWPWVQVFENKGEIMGCSSPHPHAQIWATDRVPDEAAVEDERQRAWHAAHGRALLDEVAARELQLAERVVCVNEGWIAVVPWWAAWPFETLVLPRQPWSRLDQIDEAGRAALAALLQALTIRYDNLFGCAFPYTMGWHGAPFDGRDDAPWRVHAHFYPPLLRSATVRKFMVGYEMLAEVQRDLTPEQAAARLRAQAPVHFRTARQPLQETVR